MEHKETSVVNTDFESLEARVAAGLSRPRQVGKSALLGMRYGVGKKWLDHIAAGVQMHDFAALEDRIQAVQPEPPRRKQAKPWERGFIPSSTRWQPPALKAQRGWNVVEGKYSQWPYLITGSQLLGWSVTHVRDGKVWRGRNLDTAFVWVEMDKGHRETVKQPQLNIYQDLAAKIRQVGPEAFWVHDELVETEAFDLGAWGQRYVKT